MNKVVAGLVVCAITAQIVYPLVTGSTRDTVTVAVVVLLAAASITHAALSRGAVWAIALLIGTAGVGLVAEMLGTATGFPFGDYYYATDRLGPDIVGVPAVVPLAWTAGFYPIWCAVGYVLRRSGQSQEWTSVHRAVVTAIGMVGWDLYLDTQMVADGQWTWTSSISGLPGLPSIPVSNYLGWFVVALVMSAFVEFVSVRLNANEPRDPASRKPAVSDTAPLVLFMWTWIGSALAHSVLLTGPELRYSAMYGFAAMGIVGVPLVWALVESGRGRTPAMRKRTSP